MKNLIFPKKRESEPVLELINPEQNYRGLGGEIFQHKQKTEKIIWSIIGVLTFVAFNIILSLLTKL